MRLFYFIINYSFFFFCCFASVGQFKVAENIYINIPGKYPNTFTPTWNYVRTINNSVDADSKTPVKVENFIDNVIYDRLVNVFIGSYEGKAVIFTNYAGGNLQIADIRVDQPTILTSNPQTFILENFRLDYSKIRPEKFKSPIYSNFGGRINLSTNSNGDLIMSYVLETYNATGAMTFRMTANDFTIAMKELPSLEQTAINLKIEKFAFQHIEGWYYDQYYTPGNITNVRVLSKDIKGNPNLIRFESQLLGRDRDHWIDIYLDNNQPFGITFWEKPDYILIPTKNLDGTNFSDTQLWKNKIARQIYLYNKMKENDSHLSTDVLLFKCFKSTKINNYEPTYTYTPDISISNDGTQRVEGYDKRISGSKVVGEETVYYNECNFKLKYRYVRINFERNAVSYSDNISLLEPLSEAEFARLRNTKTFDPNSCKENITYAYIFK